MQDTASALVTASTQLLEGLASGQRPLSSVSGSLAELATELGVQQVFVAVDDAVHGRQVFSSGRTLLGDRGEMLIGPPRACTDPPSRVDDTLGRLIVASVAAAFERARTGQPSQGTPAKRDSPANGTLEKGRRANDLVAQLLAATDQSTRYGWGFTLVMLRLDRDDGRSMPPITAHLRASDTLVEVGPGEYAILLPAAGGDEVPRLLARVGRDGAVSTFCYGLAACPGDGTEPGALLALATSRLSDATELRIEEPAPEVHA